MYLRDKRSPVPKSEAVSRVMSANRAENSGPELTLRSAGHRGYRLHYKIDLPPQIHPSSLIPHPSRVRPDIAFVSRRLAIFVHGCFWHRCPRCNYPLPKNNPEFWQAKFERNTARDARKKTDLKRLGWKVATVWECELKHSPERVLGDALTPSGATVASPSGKALLFRVRPNGFAAMPR